MLWVTFSKIWFWLITSVATTLRAIPFSFWFIRELDTREVEPFDLTDIVITSDHFTERNLFTQTIRRLIRINRRFDGWWSLFSLSFRFGLSFLLLRLFIPCNHSYCFLFNLDLGIYRIIIDQINVTLSTGSFTSTFRLKIGFFIHLIIVCILLTNI